MLRIHRSERADHLVAALGDLLADPIDDPMVAEVVAVPTRGVERWLTQRLSHRLGAGPGGAGGVCANVDFPFPGTVVNRATATACGIDADIDPWLPERAVWPLLELVDRHLDEDFLAPLAAHLRAAAPPAAAGDGRLRRFATVRHVADLYDRYGVHRPDMLLGWAAGDDGPAAGDRARAWQPELWRRLRRRIDAPSPAERFSEAAAALADDPALLDLPPRLSLFGLTRLPASHLTVLEAIAAGRDVHLFLLHPSGALWDRVAAGGHRAPLPRADDPTASTPANPLLRSWGRDAREMQLVLAGRNAAAGDHRPVPDGTATLLGRIQADVRADRAPAGRPAPGDPDRRPVLEPGDRSLQVHSCHGRARQVEVVRDAVAHLLASDPTLEPRDVIVMCPEVEEFAPLIHAAFDPAEAAAPDGSPGPVLRVRLADRSLRQTNPLLGVAALLVELAGARVTASEVLDLASAEPVRRRFRLDDDDLGQLERWVDRAGVRWGLDGAHRAPWGLAGLEQNTWAAGMDRVLLGVAMADETERLFGGAVPLDDVAGSDVELAGRFAELVDRLAAALGALTGPQPADRWAAALVAATESLAVAAPAERWQHDQLRRLVSEAADEAAGHDLLLDRSEVQSLLGRRLEGRPTRANFRTGDLTVCTLVPMRSVPHRVVCLLGLDDGVFPRRTERDGDDLLLAEPRVGDRDARAEDRQLLLDALLAATDHLIVTYAGRDERTNQERPPAVPIAELLDVVDRTVSIDGAPPRPDGTSARPRDLVTVAHPLQPFDPRNFADGVLGPPGPWGFDPVDLDGARARAAPRRPPQPFLAAPLPRLDAPAVELEGLVRFVQHPVREFLRERLDVYVSGGSDRPDDAIPVDLGGLEQWTVGDRLLAARLAGAAPAAAIAAERARGDLPPGALADEVLDGIAGCVDELAAVARPHTRVDPRSIEVNLRLGDGRLLVGTVAGLRGDAIVTCTYSRVAAKHRLAAWVRFLALSAARPDLAVSAVTIGRGPKDGAVARTVPLAPLDTDPDRRVALATGLLDRVVDLYDRGMTEPLPLFCDTSEAWATAVRRGTDPLGEARKKWRTAFQFGGEDRDAAHVLVHGDGRELAELCAEPPAAGEAGDGWPDEDTRVGRLARRLWDDLLDHEERSRP